MINPFDDNRNGYLFVTISYPKKFENLGLKFHKSADKMSEVFKNKYKDKSLETIAITMNYCVQCHLTFRQ